MFLEFISNPAVKFRSISCEIQKLSPKKPETILKNWENKKSAASCEDRTETQRVETRHSIHYTLWDFELFRQKDNLRVDTSRVSEAANIRLESESR